MKPDHTFAICAYKESPFLETCIQSLVTQEEPSAIILCTSTPNDLISSLANTYELPLFVNDQKPGIASDWNYALSCAQTPYVTIAHQDDVYEPAYAKRMQAAMDAMEHPLLFFTNYGELRGGERVTESNLLNAKRKLLHGLENGRNAFSKKTRRRALSLGSAICCPSVTMAVKNLPSPVFTDELKSNLDWQAWARIANLEGQFYYDSGILMYHRIHEGSETSALIMDNTRTAEDLYMLKQFWPAPVASLLNFIYKRGQKSNGS